MRASQAVLLCLLAACESKADKYVRLTHEIENGTAQARYFSYQVDSLRAAEARARATPGAAAAAEVQRVMNAKDSIFSAWIRLSDKLEHDNAELVLLR